MLWKYEWFNPPTFNLNDTTKLPLHTNENLIPGQFDLTIQCLFLNLKALYNLHKKMMNFSIIFYFINKIFSKINDNVERYNLLVN